MAFKIGDKVVILDTCVYSSFIGKVGYVVVVGNHFIFVEFHKEIIDDAYQSGQLDELDYTPRPCYITEIKLSE